MIWALILAAGESSRMGEAKLLLPFGRTSIIETVINNTVKSEIDMTMVILGKYADEIKEKIKEYPVKISKNYNFSDGMLSSIQCGFKNLPADTTAALVVLGDQPLIRSSVINRLINYYGKTEKGIILPVYNNRRGHPVIIDMKYRDAIRQLNPCEGLRELIHNHSHDILEVKTDTPDILKDIDTAEEYHEQVKYRRRS